MSRIQEHSRRSRAGSLSRSRPLRFPGGALFRVNHGEPKNFSHSAQSEDPPLEIIRQGTRQ